MSDIIKIDDPDAVEAKAPPAADKLEALRDLARQLWAAEREKAKLEAAVVAKDEEIALLETKLLPQAMRDVSMTDFGLEGGFRIELEKGVAGSIKKENEPKAFEWLEERKHGGIIKHVLTISFGKGEAAWARKFMADLAKRKKPLPVERKDSIHAGTLKKFIKEMIALENVGKLPPDQRLPRDLFGIFEFERANLIDPAAEALAAIEKGKRKKPKGAASDDVEM